MKNIIQPTPRLRRTRGKLLCMLFFVLFYSVSTQTQVKLEESKKRSTFKEKLIIAGHGISFLIGALYAYVLIAFCNKSFFMSVLAPLFGIWLGNDAFSMYTFFQLIRKKEKGATLELKIGFGTTIFLNVLSSLLCGIPSLDGFHPLLSSLALLNFFSAYTLASKYRGIFFEKTVWPEAKKTEPVVKMPEIPKEDLKKLGWV